VGSDVVFRNGIPSDTPEGRRVLGHELAHVAQRPHAGTGPFSLSSATDSAEREADAAGAALARGDRARIAARGASNTLYRLQIAATELGFWDFEQKMVGPDPIDRYHGCDVKIDFRPRLGWVDSSDIGFVQAVRIVDKAGKSREWREGAQRRFSANKWAVDRYPGSKHGWAGSSATGGDSKHFSHGESPDSQQPDETRAAHFSDTPRGFNPGLDWMFQTVAVSRAGSQSGTIYGALHWGFSVDDNQVPKALKPTVTLKPDTDFTGAVKGWNQQAARPDSDLKKDRFAKEAPGQVALPPLK